MTFEDFKEKVREGVKKYLPQEYQASKVEIQSVPKNNGIIQDALCIRTEGCGVAPVLYLDAFFDIYEGGENLERVLAWMAQMYVEAQNDSPKLSDAGLQYENVKNHLLVTVCNAEMNQKLLQTVPHELWENLALVYRMRIVDIKSGNATILVDNNWLRMWGISEAQLKIDAWKSMRQEMPAVLQSMEEVIQEMYSEFVPEDMQPLLEEGNTETMYVLSNRFRIRGAAYMFDEEALKKAADKLNGNLIILPSSVHEVLMVKETEKTDLSYLRDMVREVNENCTGTEEMLSNEIYRYDREKHTISVVTDKQQEEAIGQQNCGDTDGEIQEMELS